MARESRRSFLKRTAVAGSAAALAPFAGKGIDLCNNGDPICSQGRNPFAHTSYEKTDLVGQAAGFVSQLL